MDEMRQEALKEAENVVIFLSRLGWSEIQKALERYKTGVGLGLQPVDKLVKQGRGVSQIPISETDMADFQPLAQKYGIDYAIVRDDSAKPEKYMLFFKAQDKDALDAAITELLAQHTGKEKSKDKPSVIQRLHEITQKIKDAPKKVKNRQQERGER